MREKMKWFVGKMLFGSLLSTLLSYSSYAQSGRYELDGRVNFPLQGKAFLRCITDPTRNTDTCTINNGKFVFKGEIRVPLVMRLFLAKNLEDYQSVYVPSVVLYLEPGKIILSSSDSIDHVDISGTPLNEDNNQLNKITIPLEQRLVQLKQLQYKAASTVNRQQIVQQVAALRTQRHDAIKQFVQRHPASRVSADALDEYRIALFTDAEVAHLFDSLKPQVQLSEAGQRCAQYLTQVKATAIGALAPDFSQADTAGRLVALHSFKGQYVLIDFWASWCGPCRAESSELLAFYSRYKEKKFTVVGVSIDENRQSWLRAVSAERLPWTQLCGLNKSDGAPARLYAVDTIPRNFLIGPDGRIIAKDLHGEELAKRLAALFLTSQQ